MRWVKKIRSVGMLIVASLIALVIVSCISVCHQVLQNQLDRSLILAVRSYNSQAVLLLLAKGANPNACDLPAENHLSWRYIFSKLFGLDHRVKRHCTSMMEFVLLNADTEVEDGNRETSKIVQALISYGARWDMRDEYDVPIWLSAPDNSCLRIFLDRGADVNAESRNGMSLLLGAIKVNDTDEAKLLLSKGAKCRMYGEDISAIVAAKHYDNHPEMLAILHK
jgi:hypothetical protein